MEKEKKEGKIWTIEVENEKSFLRKKAKDFDFSKYTRQEINDLILYMRKTMIAYNGVGLAAPQIGINARVFVAQEPASNGRGYKGKFYAIFNPQVEFISKNHISDYEGCLSVPGYYGAVSRADKIIISGYDKNKRPIKIKAHGYLARIFQHEIDHLNGILFIDKAKDLNKVEA